MEHELSCYCIFLICMSGLRNMQPKPTMEQLNDEKIVSDKLDKTDDINIEIL